MLQSSDMGGGVGGGRQQIVKSLAENIHIPRYIRVGRTCIALACDRGQEQ